MGSLEARTSMIGFAREGRHGKTPTLLCLGAHADDIEIGAGGTVLRLIAENPDLSVHWVVLSADGVRRDEALASADEFLADAAKSNVTLESFRESYFPWEGDAIKDWFEGLKADVEPDLVLVHARHDLHQDHRTVSELAWNTFRDHLILEYEIPKYEGDLMTPSVYVRLDDETARRKVDILMRCFESQRSRRWFDEETFLALMRVRGVEANTRYAEGFHARKVAL